MRKKPKLYLSLILIIIVGLLILSLTSCGNEAVDSLPRILVSSSDGDVFNTSVEYIDIVGKEYQDKNADNTKSIVVNGTQENVFYEHSTKSQLTDMTVYQSKSKDITCYYDKNSDLPIQIVIQNGAIPIPDTDAVESDYRDWVEQVLATYGINDLSDYRYLCQTSVTVSNPESLYNDHYMYFYTDIKSNESINDRTFTYTKYCGDYPTTDRIYVNVSHFFQNVIIKFDRHQFTNDTEPPFNEEMITNAVRSYITNSVNTEKYKLDSMNIKNERLTVVDNQICMEIDVEITLLFKNSQESIPFTYLETLFVYPE